MKWTYLAFKLGGVLLLIGKLACGWLLFNFDRPPFDLVRLQQLRLGMWQAEVRQILGDPIPEDSDSWAYSRSLAWPIAPVYFDKDGRFTGSEHDR